MITIHNRHHVKDDGSFVYIGRGTIYGNPFPITKTKTREKVIELYGQDIASKICNNNKRIIESYRRLLPDSKLLCSCFPKDCHGRIIKEYYDEIHTVEDFSEGIRLFREKRKHLIIDPEKDGIEHINIYSAGKTDLGKVCSNFHYSKISHPEYGYFLSVEGFWHWLKLGKKYDHLRTLWGIYALKEGRNLLKNNPTSLVENECFEKEIEKCIELKVQQNEELKSALKSNNLPFKHYYVYADYCECPVQYNFICDIYERISEKLHNESFI